MKQKETRGSLISLLSEPLVGTLPERYKRPLLGEQLLSYRVPEEIPKDVVYGRRTQRATMLSAGLHTFAATVNVWYAHQTGTSLLDDHLGVDVPDLGLLWYTMAESAGRAVVSTKKKVHVGSLLGYAISIPLWSFQTWVELGHEISKENAMKRSSRKKGTPKREKIKIG